MTTLTDSDHFVPDAGIPIVRSSDALATVYALLSCRRMGGFILIEDEVATTLVRADLLLDFSLDKAGGDTQKVEALWSRPVGDAVQAARDGGAPGAGFVAIDPQPRDTGDDPSPLQLQADRVFRVEKGGAAFGWFLNHETVMATTTRRLIYICKRDHRNTDPDHGTCYKCPSAFVRTETE